MGSILSDKKNLTPKNFTQSEFKTYVGLVDIKIGQIKNKKLKEISNKRKEIGNCLGKNQLDIAKLKMDNIINEENYIIALDILITLIEILKEKVVYLLSYDKCPEDVRSTLDTIIYCSNRIDIPELAKIREGISIKYGSIYVTNAINNQDKLVSLAIVDKLSTKPNPNFLLLTRLKQLALEEKIDYFFPPDYDIGNENVGDQNFFNGSMKPTDMQGGFDPQVHQSYMFNNGTQYTQNMSVQGNFQVPNQVADPRSINVQTSQIGFQPNNQGIFQYSQMPNNQVNLNVSQPNLNLNPQSQNFNQSQMNNIMNQPPVNNFSGGFQNSQFQNLNYNNPNIQNSQSLQNQNFQAPNYNYSQNIQQSSIREEVKVSQSNQMSQYSQDVNPSIKKQEYNYNPSLQVPQFNYNPSIQIPQFNYNPSIQNPQLNYNPIVQNPQPNYNPSIQIQDPQISKNFNSSLYYQGKQQIEPLNNLPVIDSKSVNMSIQQPSQPIPELNYGLNSQNNDPHLQSNISQLNNQYLSQQGQINPNSFSISQQPFGFKSEVVQPNFNYQQPQFQYKPPNEIGVNQSFQQPKPILENSKLKPIADSNSFQPKFESSNVFLNNQSNFLPQPNKNESNDFQLFSSSNLKSQFPKSVEKPNQADLPDSAIKDHQSYSYQNYKNLSVAPESDAMAQSVIIPSGKGEIGSNYMGAEIQDPYHQIGSSLNFFNQEKVNEHEGQSNFFPNDLP